MVFYRITRSSNRKEVGFDPQISFISGNKEIPTDGPIYNYGSNKYKTNAGAKVTDFIPVDYPGSSFVLSSKAKALLEGLRLPRHQFIEVEIEHRKAVEEPYYYFHIYENNFDMVNYDKSVLEFFLLDGVEEKQFRTEKDLIQYLEIQGYPSCFPKELYVKNFEILRYDWLNLCRVDVYPIVSDRFKKAYMERRLLGLEFLSCPYLDHYK